MKNIKAFICTFLLIGMACANTGCEEVANAAGHIGQDNVKQYLRTSPEESFSWQQPNMTQNLSVVADLTVGVGGVIMAATMATQLSHITWTSSIGAVPYPCTIKAAVLDTVKTANTLACSSVKIFGFDQFGQPQNETLTSLTETAIKETSYAYSVVTNVQATGCSGASDSGDILRLSCNKYGLPFPIESVGALRSVCVQPRITNTPGRTNCWAGAAVSEDVSLVYYTLDIAGLGTSDTPGPAPTSTTGDIVRLNILSPNGR